MTGINTFADTLKSVTPERVGEVSVRRTSQSQWRVLTHSFPIVVRGSFRQCGNAGTPNAVTLNPDAAGGIRPKEDRKGGGAKLTI